MAGRQDGGNVKQEGPKQEPITPNKQGNMGVSGGPGGGGGPMRGGRGGRRGGGPNRFGGGGGDRGPQQSQRQEEGRNFGPDKGGNPARRGGRGGGMTRNGEGGGGPARSQDDRINERLAALNGPAYELPTVDTSEKKFSGRNRLYIGNLSADVTDEEITELFKPFGETSELFINKEKNFGFIRMDYHTNAEKAKRELDGTIRKGRTLKVRFAPNGATLKVKNLTPWVTNELLHIAFSVFGEIERCVVIVDDHGKSTGEGLIEFARKPSAVTALRHCSEGCFFLTSSLRPVIAEMHEQMDIVDGYPEKNLSKKNPEFHRAREVGPRFATLGSFEHEYGTRWKQLHELYKQKEVSLKQELAMEEDKLEAQMQLAKFESETEMLREQLRLREMDRERQKREWEERERMAEEARIRNEQMMRRQEEEMQMRMHHQEEDMRRRQQENNLFMQANQLSSLLDQQEQVMQSYNESPGGSQRDDYDQQQGGEGPPMDPKQFMNNYERHNRYDNRGDMGPRPNSPRNRGPWRQEHRRDDFQNKRRRYQI